eukprot:TRINITY_DN29323_c0_g1_i1.p2 TRINITY_DN29323_c0_g1~~TRINITY_DN29323_c0_g1_i1.p2  ORF type:complete len:103 (-),score=37.85 TRINITY_DN29323_c0_g1_i1:2-310(-)
MCIRDSPDGASKSVGTIAFKRMTCESQEKGMNCATYKTGVCIDCGDVFKFGSKAGYKATDKETENFAENCVTVAFNQGGGLKSDFKCSDNDQMIFQRFLTTL